MQLTELIRNLDVEALSPADVGIEIAGLSADSRKVKPGDLFVALPGTKTHGTKYIPQALQRGALAILSARRTPCTEADSVVRLHAEKPQHVLARMSARRTPGQPSYTVAVTGTNGKTSVATFFRQLLCAQGEKAASIGTLGVWSCERKLEDSKRTTPDALTLHPILSDLAKTGTRYLALEASSHGLEQARLDGVRLHAAAFTNFSIDHLDYHKTERAYFSSKSRLFSELLTAGSRAVLNADSDVFLPLSDICRKHSLTVVDYGRRGSSIHLGECRATHKGYFLTLEMEGKTYEVRFPVFGSFQVSNLLAALGLAHACGVDARTLMTTIPDLSAPPGRMELVATSASKASIYVDYAHTPEALSVVLQELRTHARKVHLVFGCGGNRERKKRALMGRIAARLADRVIVTDDNPRTESPTQIRRQILRTAVGAEEIGDRREAILKAIEGLASGDVLLIAGKGHEQSQLIGGQTLPFNDRQIAFEAAVTAGGRPPCQT